jgi:Uma2 family endonuclease
MNGATVHHGRIRRGLHAALRARLKGRSCELLGPQIGIATIGEAVRCPDALITCTHIPGAARLVSDAVVVFEVLSPNYGRTDRIEKVREYHAVPSILRYVILEYTSAALTVFERTHANDPWTATTLTADELIKMPEIGTIIPVSELYADVELSPADAPST